MNKTINLAILIALSFFVFSCNQKEYVKDFKVEGIGVGDSLLTYFSEDDILKLQRKADIMGNPIELEGRVYIDSVFENYEFETYESIQMYYKIDDKKYIIHGVGGGIFYESNAKKCNEKFYEVKKLLSEQYTTPEITEFLDEKDGREGMGNSKFNEALYNFEDGSSIKITCKDIDNEVVNVQDYFQLTIFSNEINEHFNLITLQNLLEDSE